LRLREGGQGFEREGKSQNLKRHRTLEGGPKNRKGKDPRDHRKTQKKRGRSVAKQCRNLKARISEEEEVSGGNRGKRLQGREVEEEKGNPR